MSTTSTPDILQAIRDANTQSGQFGITAIVAGLVTSAVISSIVFVIFSVLRPRHKIVYAPKLKYASEKRAPPPIDDGLFSWLKPVWQCTDEYLLERIGLDAVLFLRFWRMCRNIFICIGLLGITVIIPFNVVVGLKTVSGQANVAKNKYFPCRDRADGVRLDYCRLKALSSNIYGCKSSFVGCIPPSSYFGSIEIIRV